MFEPAWTILHTSRYLVSVYWAFSKTEIVLFAFLALFISHLRHHVRILHFRDLARHPGTWQPRNSTEQPTHSSLLFMCRTPSCSSSLPTALSISPFLLMHLKLFSNSLVLWIISDDIYQIVLADTNYISLAIFKSLFKAHICILWTQRHIGWRDRDLVE